MAKPKQLSPFDADAHSAALTRPSVKIGGRVRSGRILSVLEWQPFQEKVEQLEKGQLDQEGIFLLFEDYARAIFRRPWYKGGGRRIVGQIMALPPGVLLETFRDFFECQARASKPGTVRSTTASQSGNGSSRQRSRSPRSPPS